jgi:hypothetical protein
MKEPVFFFHVVQAVGEAIAAADPERKKALAITIDEFASDEPGTFYWAIGPQAPVFLRDLLITIDRASTEKTNPRDNVVKLVRD